MGIGDLWSILILRPMLNVLVVLYWLLQNNFGVSIVVFTALVRVITLPLTIKQTRTMKVQQELQPKLQELQRKYAGDREKLSQEQMKLYKEHGANPLGGCLPLIIQMPIWLGLYQSIYRMLGGTPEQLIDLYKQLYLSIPLFSRIAQQAVPFQSHFLWLDLARPDPYYILPILVAASTWLSQKTMATPTPGDGGQQRSMTQSMQVFMPLMMGFMSLQFASGLAVYFLASNVLQIIQQWMTTGETGLNIKLPWRPSIKGILPSKLAAQGNPVVEVVATSQERPLGKEKTREQRKKRRKRRS